MTNDGGASWTESYRGEVTPEVMDFVDDENGWVAGCILSTGVSRQCDRPLLATHDGGKTWTRVTSYTGGAILSISFVSPQDGWILADPCEPRCEVGRTQLFRTTDGGETWSKLNIPEDTIATSLQRVDANAAWDVTNTKIFGTADGGETWTSSDNPCDLVQNDWGAGFRSGPFDFIDAAHGWIGCTSRNGGGGMAAKTLYGTVDGGTTWQLLAETQTASIHSSGVGALSWGGGVVDLDFVDADTGFLDLDGPPGSFIYHTDDGGRTWTAIDDGVGGGISHLTFADQAHGWAWGGGILLRTTDSGAHWDPVDLPPALALHPSPPVSR